MMEPMRRRLARRLAIAGAIVAVVVVLGGVAVWVWLARLFDEPAAAVVPSLVERLGTRSLLAVFAHPDDEIKAAGFLADAGARPGVAARMITAARGNGGIASDTYPRAELARVREAEVRQHGAALGLDEQEVWPYDDARLAEAPARELSARIIERLRKWRPDTVLTFEPTTGYTAHPDHLRIGALTTEAFCSAADGDWAPRWLVYVLAPRGAARRFGGARGRLVADREPAATLAIAVAPAIKLRAWQIHRSQSDYVRRFAHVPPWLLYRLFDKEHYLVRERATVCNGR
jgi:LmbE family N-acetylglucosaminyl deacetylase